MQPAVAVPTRLLILSDTHGASPAPLSSSSSPFPPGYRHPLPSADVVLHCGDLTRHGTSSELCQAFALLRSLDAPLKLVIAGNHDVGLESVSARDSRLVEEAIDKARLDGVHYLLEGTHDFTLANGARLRVYASPWTPAYGSWAFQYPRGQHAFSIPRDVDVVMTHGPPRGILDGAGPRRSTGMKVEAAGCADLLRAVSAARPKIHCFGHIHEGWGSYLATWKPRTTGDHGKATSCQTLVDGAQSHHTCLQDLDAASSSDEGHHKALLQKLARFSAERGVHVDIAKGEDRLKDGEQTLFLNAAIMSMRYRPVQLPWIVDVLLRRP